MKWEELRTKYPDTWILFEALEAHSKEGHRFVDNILVLDTFKEGDQALSAYRVFHKKEPQRELYIAHTKKEMLEIVERQWLGNASFLNTARSNLDGPSDWAVDFDTYLYGFPCFDARRSS